MPTRRRGGWRCGGRPWSTSACWHLPRSLTLPIALASLPPPAPGQEALWVPALLALSVGPVFLLVSAQAPLMQRWFAADPQAGNPYALYAASNLGSFAGLIAYPLLAEPLLGLREQSWGWSAGLCRADRAGRLHGQGALESDRRCSSPCLV